jgi:hypothetical protein
MKTLHARAKQDLVLVQRECPFWAGELSYKDDWLVG